MENGVQIFGVWNGTGRDLPSKLAFAFGRRWCMCMCMRLENKEISGGSVAGVKVTLKAPRESYTEQLDSNEYVDISKHYCEQCLFQRLSSVLSPSFDHLERDNSNNISNYRFNLALSYLHCESFSVSVPCITIPRPNPLVLCIATPPKPDPPVLSISILPKPDLPDLCIATPPKLELPGPEIPTLSFGLCRLAELAISAARLLPTGGITTASSALRLNSARAALFSGVSLHSISASADDLPLAFRSFSGVTPSFMAFHRSAVTW